MLVEEKGVRNYVVKIFGSQGHMVWRRHSDQLKFKYNDDSSDQTTNGVESNHAFQGDIDSFDHLPNYVPEPVETPQPEVVHTQAPVPLAISTHQAQLPVQAHMPASPVAKPPQVSVSSPAGHSQQEVCSTPAVVTRSGRHVKKPSRFS